MANKNSKPIKESAVKAAGKLSKKPPGKPVIAKAKPAVIAKAKPAPAKPSPSNNGTKAAASKVVARMPAGKPQPVKSQAVKSQAVKAPAAKAPPAKVAAGKTPQIKTPPGKPQTAKPQTGKPQPGKPQPGKAQPGKPQPGKPSAQPVVADGKNGRKGITIVSPKPVKKVKPKPRAPISGVSAVPASLSSRSGLKPLIPSGPAASPSQPLGYHGQSADGPRHETKSPFGKRELAHFRQILLQKRVELVRDVSSMESEALKGESGSLSSLPQHLAEQGSETYDQSLSLDLAAYDRKLIKEIDDALARIEKGTYGICELTGKPIKVERLEELPWARYSIEAARDLERRQMRL